MKTLRTLCAAVVLTLALTTAAFAGVISTPVAPPPPSETTSATTEGNISTMSVESEEAAGSNSVTETALNLLQSLLLLF